LPQVEHLVLSVDANTLTVATAIDLPVLSRVTLLSLRKYGEVALRCFLCVHGSNITYLDLSETGTDGSLYMNTHDISTFLKPDGCPNLLDLVYHMQYPPMEPLSHPHKSLRRIGLCGVDKALLRGAVKRHFQTFHRGTFPVLEVVRTVGFLVVHADRADYPDGTKDTFIGWVEEFEEDGVDLQDGEGVVWIRCEDDPSSPASSF